MADSVLAAVVTAPRALEVREFERPRPLGSDFLVEIDLCGVCGTDVHYFMTDEPFSWTSEKTRYPFIIGHEFTSRIVETGPEFAGVDALGSVIGPGDRIAVAHRQPCWRCYACRVLRAPNLCERGVLPRDAAERYEMVRLAGVQGGYAQVRYVSGEALVFKVPPYFPPRLAVLIEPMAVALRSLQRAFQPGVPEQSFGFGPGQTVVVQGAGAIGALSAVAAHLLGAARVILIGAPESRLAICRSMGVDVTINIERYPPHEVVEMALDATPRRMGADLVIEAAGSPPAFRDAILLCRRGGTIVEVGHFTRRGTIDVDPSIICYKDLRIFGSWIYGPEQFGVAVRFLDRYRQAAALDRLVTHEFPLEESARAIEVMRRGECLKAVVVPGMRRPE